MNPRPTPRVSARHEQARPIRKGGDDDTKDKRDDEFVALYCSRSYSSPVCAVAPLRHCRRLLCERLAPAGRLWLVSLEAANFADGHNMERD